MSDKPSLGGARKKNGHKQTCSCHICENMKNKENRGGYEKEAKYKEEKRRGVPQKKNGHRSDCSCPICKNMKNSRKKRGGGEECKDESDNEIPCPKETPATEADYEDIEGGSRRKTKKQKRSARRKTKRHRTRRRY